VRELPIDLKQVLLMLQMAGAPFQQLVVHNDHAARPLHCVQAQHHEPKEPRTHVLPACQPPLAS
jgi:hypothetical protein